MIRRLLLSAVVVFAAAAVVVFAAAAVVVVTVVAVVVNVVPDVDVVDVVVVVVVDVAVVDVDVVKIVVDVAANSTKFSSTCVLILFVVHRKLFALFPVFAFSVQRPLFCSRYFFFR